MATMEIISHKCELCEATATRRVRNGDGMVVGEFCARHGNAELIKAAKYETPKLASAAKGKA